MSPTSSSSTIYDHLLINFHQQPKMTMRNNANIPNTKAYDINNKLCLSNSKSDCNSLLIKGKSKFILCDEQRSRRRYTMTHFPMTEPILRCSVSNQGYEKPLLHKPLTISTINKNDCDSRTSSNMEYRQMDFRPLITKGRRRFTTISTVSPMIIIKKKSPSPLHTNNSEQKPLNRSIPVNITSNNTAMFVSTVIPTSLSYSSSCSSSITSTSSTNTGIVSVPIQVVKTEKNNTYKNNITYTQNTNGNVESHKGYRYCQKQTSQIKSKTNFERKNQVRISDIDNGNVQMPSSSSSDGVGYEYNQGKMTDSNVLRLIRLYDPVGSSSLINNKSRRSLDNTRGVWHTIAPNAISSVPSNISASSCSIFSQRTLPSTYDDSKPLKPTPRLQRQKSIHEHETCSPSNGTDSLRPILKYTFSKSHTEFNIPKKKLEPLKIEIEPQAPSAPPPPPRVTINENHVGYQPLITTGTKRVCTAVSKSEWDLRLQQDPSAPVVPPPPNHPVRPPSPQKAIIREQERKYYRPLLGRSKSSMGINNTNEQNDDIDDFDENSLPIATGSSVEKLKQMFSTKSSLDLTNSSMNKQQRFNVIEPNLSQHSRKNGIHGNKTNTLSSTPSLIQNFPHSNLIEMQTRSINNPNLNKSTSTIQEPISTSLIQKRNALENQKNFHSIDSFNHTNNNSTMASPEVSYDAYRFRRLNDHEQKATMRTKNVAKVEPYSINTKMVRPLYQMALSQSTPTTKIPSKVLNGLNGTGTNPINSSTSSSVGSLGGTIRHPNVRHSDFLEPNPTYSMSPPPNTVLPPPQSLSMSQPLSSSSSYATPPSSSMLLSESLSQGLSYRMPSNHNTTLYNRPSPDSILSKNHSQHKNKIPNHFDAYPNKQANSLSTHNNSNAATANNNKHEKYDNHSPPISYHYRPKELNSSATTTTTNKPISNGRQQSSGLVRGTAVEQYVERTDGGQQQQSRRRFQRRKQMKRSKSADLYQELSTKNQNLNNYGFQSTMRNDKNEQQRSISRDLIRGGEEELSLSSSSSSSSSTANIERINQAALLRYKSLDSMTFNNRKINSNGKNTNRRMLTKQADVDFDSDDSVCGIPKPRRTIGR